VYRYHRKFVHPKCGQLAFNLEYALNKLSSVSLDIYQHQRSVALQGHVYSNVRIVLKLRKFA